MLLSLCVAGSACTFALVPDEDPQFESHGSHQHGSAQLTLVIEGNEGELAFDSPVVNLTGFEHKSETAEEQKKLQSVMAGFQAGQWFRFNPEAGCSQVNAEVNSELERGAAQNHADLNASYSLLCQNPTQLTNLTVEFKDLGAGIEKVMVQWVVNGQQGVSEWTAQQPSIKLELE